MNDFYQNLQEPQVSDGSDWRFLGPQASRLGLMVEAEARQVKA
jgi:hypothetical protein